jgi:glycosyltransferase involved in cell wall biosynthesis
MAVIPNSYSYAHPLKANQIASGRNQVIGKCYGELFGLGSIILECTEMILRENPQIEVFLYSVTKDLEKQADILKNLYPRRLRYFTVHDPLSHEALLGEFAKSRVYIGASRSDGISTSFLEAMSQGAYPVQTNTSCASEWLQMGCVGSVVGTTKDEIYKAINSALKDDELVNSAQKENTRVLSETTNFEVLSEAARAFYS